MLNIVIIVIVMLISIIAPHIATAQLASEYTYLFSSNEWISNVTLAQMHNMNAVTALAGENIIFSCSLDYGTTWSDFHKINQHPARTSSITIADDGTVFISWIEINSNTAVLKFKKCKDKCSQCTESTDIALNVMPSEKPILYNYGTMLALFYFTSEQKGSLAIIRISHDQGITWDDEIQLNKKIKKRKSSIPSGGGGDLIIASSGIVYAVWLERNKNENSIAFTYSQDRGITFLPPILIKKISVTSHCINCTVRSQDSHLQIFAEGDNLYLFYLTHSKEKSNLYAIASQDGGKKWKKPVLLSKKFSFVRDYSVVMNDHKFLLALFRKDEEHASLYYSELDKNPFEMPLHTFLVDNNGSANLFKGKEGELMMLFTRWDETAKESFISVAPVKKRSLIPGDQDNDGIPDSFEDELLYKFRPHWYINKDDPAELPVRLKANSCSPEIEAKDGTIYGEVFRHDWHMKKTCSGSQCSCTTYHFIEMHFFDIWGADKLIWPFRRHEWDQEHVSARAVHEGIPNPYCDPNWHPVGEQVILWDSGKWQVDLWKFFAHEGSLCQKIKQREGIFDMGIDVWVSYKHGTFPGNKSCNKFFRFWCPDGCYGNEDIGRPVPINIGQADYPLNGACWVSWNGFLTGIMDPDLPAP